MTDRMVSTVRPGCFLDDEARGKEPSAGMLVVLVFCLTSWIGIWARERSRRAGWSRMEERVVKVERSMAEER